MANIGSYNKGGRNTYSPPCETMQQWIDWLKLNPRDLRKLPEQFFCDEFFLSIVNTNGFAVGSIPFKHLTPKILITALKRDPMALNNIPEILRTPFLCKIAIDGDLKAIRFVPDSIFHLFVDSVLEKDGLQCRYIIDKLSQGQIELAVKSTPKALQFVPIMNITSSMVERAIDADEEVLQYVPEFFLTDELILKALKKDKFGWVFESIPEKLKTNFIEYKKEIDIYRSIF